MSRCFYAARTCSEISEACSVFIRNLDPFAADGNVLLTVRTVENYAYFIPSVLVCVVYGVSANTRRKILK